MSNHLVVDLSRRSLLKNMAGVAALVPVLLPYQQLAVEVEASSGVVLNACSTTCDCICPLGLNEK